jgi:molybdopterin converting factor small subunit
VTITVEVSGTLRSRIASETTLDDVNTVGQAIEQLHLPPTVALIMLVNGRIAHWTSELRDGDVLQLIPTIGGGCMECRA